MRKDKQNPARWICLCALVLFMMLETPCAMAKTAHGDSITGKIDLLKGLGYNVEAQATASNNVTPLWLNANKYGLSSLRSFNGYLRAGVERPLAVDSGRRWGLGYGVDLVAPLHFTSPFIVQQAYAEARWLHGTLTVGSKQYPMELKNNSLSSGSQTLGINARPVPQVRLALPEYWAIPFTKGWVSLKGHLAYGMMTDDGWQHDFTAKQSKYADHVLYHSKAGYLKIGDGKHLGHITLELGLEMAAQFGGTSHKEVDGVMTTVQPEKGFKAFWHALIPGGADGGETVYTNMSGNQVGSWLARINYENNDVKVGVYADKYFEDQSAMFLVDYDGYGSGSEWQQKQKSRYFVYDLKDMMLGAELNLKHGTWLRNVVFEYIYTKYQSGPVYHDHTAVVPDHVCGMDNYYNHYVYPGWQHWGQVIGNPLFRSPIYNTDGSIAVKNSRFMAFHLGFDGSLSKAFSYRALATWQDGLGTYQSPYTRKHHNVSFMVESTCRLKKGWTITGAYGMDFGHILGNNAGFQLTVAKCGLL
jgi:hypothetical protein